MHRFKALPCTNRYHKRYICSIMEYSFIDVDSVADAEFDVTSRYCYSDFVCGI